MNRRAGESEGGSTAAREPSHVRARIALGVLVAVALGLIVAAGLRRAPFSFEQGLLRLGQSSSRIVVGGVSRPVLDGDDARLVVEIPPGTSGTLALGAVASPGQQPDGDARCRVTLRPRDAASPIVLAVDLGSDRSWTDVQMPLPALPTGANLDLECDGAGSVDWAQPVVSPPDPSRAPPLVIVLSLDTLRADRVAGFAETPVPTPALAAIGSEGTVFTAAVSPYTWTLPGHFALFYSRFYGFPASRAQAIGSLAGTFSKHGYATGGFTGGGFVGSPYHFDRGFDRYADYNASEFGVSELDVLPGLLEDAEEWIRSRSSAPTFVFLHTYAVHERPRSEREKNPGALLERPTMPGAEEVRVAREFYDELVARLDSVLAPFFDRLRILAARRPTLLVVLSDHGEAFGEHGTFRHGSSGPNVSLHDEVVHIPMIFWAPGVLPSGRALRNPFSLFDVAPTVLAAVDLPAPESMIGRDFWPLLRRDWSRFAGALQARWDAPVVSHRPAGLGAPAAWSTRTASRKRILEWTRKGAPVSLEIYDLDQDPGEKTNLIGQSWESEALEISVDLQDLLRRDGLVAAAPEEVLPVCPLCEWNQIQPFWETVLSAQGMDSGSGELAPETRRRLQSLGYLE